MSCMKWRWKGSKVFRGGFPQSLIDNLKETTILPCKREMVEIEMETDCGKLIDVIVVLDSRQGFKTPYLLERQGNILFVGAL